MAQEMKVRKSVRATISIGAIGLMLMGFQNCSEAQFNGDPEFEISSLESRSVNVSFEKVYSVDDSNIDIVWLIDNSPSMGDETEIIRKNITRLLDKIESRANLKLSIFSSDDPDYGIALSEFDLEKGYVQINKKQSLGKALDEIIKHLPDLISENLIRENSKKIFIFAGDTDISSDKSQKSSEGFLTAIRDVIRPQDLTFYNFVALPNSKNCKISDPAYVAIKLADESGGDSYDICKSDWSESFDALLKNISRLAKTEFVLSSQPKSNLQVRVNGVLTDRYVVEGLSLILDPSNFPEKSIYRIQVDYER